MSERYKAFISYSHADEVWASWLHRALERYRIPKRLVATHDIDGGRLAPVFRDRDELSASQDLSDVIKQALDSSDALIVMCSANARASTWVGEEIRYFQSLGRGDRIFACLIDAPEQSFPEALLIGPDGASHEPLAADARDEGDGRNVAFLKLVAALIGVRFDELTQREAHRKQRRLAAITAAAVVGMLVTSSLAFWAVLAERDADRQRQVAEAARARAQDEAEKTQAVNEFLTSTFAMANPFAGGRKDIPLLEALRRSEDAIATTFADKPDIEAAVRATVGVTYMVLSEHERAAVHLERALELRQRHHAAPHADTATSLMALSNLARERGDHERAIDLGEQAVAMQERVGEGTLALIPHLDNLVSALLISGDYARARAVAGRASGILEAVDAPPLERAQAAFTRANVEGFAGESAAAADFADEALRLRREGGAPAPLIAESLNLVGTSALGLGDLEQAETHLAEAAEVARAALGRNHIQTAVYLENLGNVYFRSKRPEESLALLDEVLEIRTAVLGANHEMVGRTLANIGTIHGTLDRYERSSRYLARALDIFEAHLDADHPLIAHLLYNIAGWDLEMDAPTAAVARLERALEIRAQVFGARAWQTAEVHQRLGQAYRALRQGDAAEDALGLAEAIFEETLGASDERTQKVRALRAGAQ